MNNRTKARGGLIPRAFTITTIFHGRRDYNSAVNHVNKSCGHQRAVVRSVAAPGGEAVYSCRACYQYLRAVEVRAIQIACVKRQLDNLFREHCPRIFWSGGVVAPIGVERRAA